MDNTTLNQSDIRRFFIFLALYFILHIIIRLLISPSVELDEAEQLILSQEIRWGYGSQPPLYTWLQSGVFLILGQGIFALATLKSALLFLTYFFTCLASLEITRKVHASLMASAMLFLVPQFAWESQRSLTNSVLATMCVAMTFYMFVRLAKKRTLLHYAAIGVCAGLGLLAKYNYVFFLAALVLAVFSMKEFRSIFASRKSLLSLVLMLAITFFHFQWALKNMDAALEHVNKSHIGQQMIFLADRFTGISSLITAILSFLAPLLAACAVFVWRKKKVDEGIHDCEEYGRLMERILLAIFIFCLIMIVFFRVTHFKDRWMQPLLLIVPLYLVCRFDMWRRIQGERYFLRLAASVAMLVLVALPSRTLFASVTDSWNCLNKPYEAFARGLKKQGFKEGVIVAGTREAGGSMKLFFHSSVVVVPDLARFRTPMNVPWLIVWDADEAGLPKPLQDFVANVLGRGDIASVPPKYLTAPYRFGKGKTMMFGYIILNQLSADIRSEGKRI